jgi:hypothetical protein
MDLDKYEAIDWDDEEEQPDERLNNLLHGLRHGVDERVVAVVAEVLSEEPVEIRLPTQMTEGAFVGPDRARSHLWTLLFDTSYERGDWLRPVTGWTAKPAEIREWERQAAQVEGMAMSDEHRRSERERREFARQHAGEVVEGSGRPAAPRRLDQMVSLRLEPELAAALRGLAERRGVTMSELLREGAIALLEEDRGSTAPSFTWHVVSTPDVPKLPQRQPA